MGGRNYLCTVCSVFSFIIYCIFKGCVLNVKEDLHSKSPIILNKKYHIIIPEARAGNIVLQKSREVLLACPGETNAFEYPRLEKNVKLLTATCVQGTTFDLGTKVNMQNVSCDKIPESIPKVKSNTCNDDRNVLAEIGFQIEKAKFFKMIEICFDKTKCSPVYTKHTLYPSISARQSGSSVSFRNAEKFLFDNLKDRPADLYPCKTQRETFLRILGTNGDVNKYLSCSDHLSVLVKGHLSPKADFIFSYQQKATYYHSNVAPQWQFFNNRNWRILEANIRSHVEAMGREHYVFTGTSKEVTSLLDSNNNEDNIYLSEDRKLPAPLYFWKILYDRKTKSGIGFIGYNVHYELSPSFFKTPSYESLCIEKLWFKESEINMEGGLIFCMEIHKLLTVTEFEDFNDEVNIVTEYKSKQFPRVSTENVSTTSTPTCNSASTQILDFGLKITFIVYANLLVC